MGAASAQSAVRGGLATQLLFQDARESTQLLPRPSSAVGIYARGRIPMATQKLAGGDECTSLSCSCNLVPGREYQQHTIKASIFHDVFLSQQQLSNFGTT